MLIKSMIYSWKADVFCFQDSKLEGDIRGIVKELWADRWVKFAQLEASGTRRHRFTVGKQRLAVWALILLLVSSLVSLRILPGTSLVYMLQKTRKREKKYGGKLVLLGDYSLGLGWCVGILILLDSLLRRIIATESMSEFSEFIKDMGLVDLQLLGRIFTWKKGKNHDIAVESAPISIVWSTMIGMKALEILNNQLSTKSFQIILL